MTDIPMPKIILLRCQNILKKEVSACYKTNDPDVVKCLTGNDIVYVDIMKREEVPAALLSVHVDETEAKEDEKLITRTKALSAEEPKKIAKSKSSTPKASSTKKKK